MKTVKTIALRSLVVMITFLAISMTAYHTNQTSAATETRELSADCGVTETDIVKYLNAYGYEVFYLEPVSGCCDVYARTQFNFRTRVFIKERIIITHEDEQIITHEDEQY